MFVFFPDFVAESQALQHEKDAHGPHLLERLQRRQANHRHLDRKQRPYDEEERVGQVQLRAVHASEDQRSCMQADHVQDKGVSTPRGHHAEVAQARERTEGPRIRAAHRPTPEIKGRR